MHTHMQMAIHPSINLIKLIHTGSTVKLNISFCLLIVFSIVSYIYKIQSVCVLVCVSACLSVLCSLCTATVLSGSARNLACGPTDGHRGLTSSFKHAPFYYAMLYYRSICFHCVCPSQASIVSKRRLSVHTNKAIRQSRTLVF